MVKNPHRAVVLKMSCVTACNLKYLLNEFALKHIRAFEGIDSVEYTECLAWLQNIQIAIDSSNGERQVCIDVKLPHRKPLM